MREELVGSDRCTAAGLRLYIGGRLTGVTVEPDGRYPDMWRIHAAGEAASKAGRVSDMVNLARAKDAALLWARPRGLGGAEVARWHRREGRVAAPSMRGPSDPLPRVPSASNNSPAAAP